MEEAQGEVSSNNLWGSVVWVMVWVQWCGVGSVVWGQNALICTLL